MLMGNLNRFVLSLENYMVMVCSGELESLGSLAIHVYVKRYNVLIALGSKKIFRVGGGQRLPFSLIKSEFLYF